MSYRMKISTLFDELAQDGFSLGSACAMPVSASARALPAIAGMVRRQRDLNPSRESTIPATRADTADCVTAAR